MMGFLLALCLLTNRCCTPNSTVKKDLKEIEVPKEHSTNSGSNELRKDSLIFKMKKDSGSNQHKMYENIIYRSAERLNLVGGELINIKGDFIKKDKNALLFVVVNIKNVSGESFFYKRINIDEFENNKAVSIQLPSYIVGTDHFKVYIQNTEMSSYSQKNIACSFLKVFNSETPKQSNISCALFNHSESSNGILQWNKTASVTIAPNPLDHFKVPNQEKFSMSYRVSLFEQGIDSTLSYSLKMTFKLPKQSNFEIKIKLLSKSGEIKYSKKINAQMVGFKAAVWNILQEENQLFNLEKSDVLSVSVINLTTSGFFIKDLCLETNSSYD